MARLTSAQAAELSAALPELYALSAIERFPARVLALVGRLIECDHVSYNEIDIARGGHRVLVDTPELVRKDAAEAFEAHVHEHPVIAHYAATGDSGSRLISDFLSSRQLHRLGLYAEVFARIGVETQLSTTMTTTHGGSVIGVALNRGKHGFSEQERMLLDLLCPHIALAHSNALRYTAALAEARSTSEHSAAAAAALACLTERQHEVLGLVSQGHTNQQIAHELDISVATVKKHLEHILDRLDVYTRVAAASRYLAATPPPAIHGSWSPTFESQPRVAGAAINRRHVHDATEM
jgi:DNA-binding CsgD family transcriptional regulator